MKNLPWMFACILLALWVVGMVAHVTLGGLLHLLLVLMVIAVVHELVGALRA